MTPSKGLNTINMFNMQKIEGSREGIEALLKRVLDLERKLNEKE